MARETLSGLRAEDAWRLNSPDTMFSELLSTFRPLNAA